jgi:hypothetical protein
MNENEKRLKKAIDNAFSKDWVGEKNAIMTTEGMTIYMSRKMYDEIKNEIISEVISIPEHALIYNAITNTYFGFVRKHPGICASSKTIEGVHNKLKLYLRDAIDQGLIDE